MNTLEHLLQGFGVALAPVNLLLGLIGSFIGTVVGMLPGLGPINGVAILMPLAFALKLPPESALGASPCPQRAALRERGKPRSGSGGVNPV